LTKKTCRPDSGVRNRVAREAATLLYFGLEKEYRQAKLKAAENLRVHVLPSNLEVALELDKLAEETEGPARTQRLIKMRSDALALMKTFKDCCPVLIGSVWRGTIRRGSDIDIELFSDQPQQIAAQAAAEGLKIFKTQTMTVNEHGVTSASFHVYALISPDQIAEITVRSTEEAGKKRKCDTFGDEIKGLKIEQLEKVLKENPAQRFLPTHPF
jgi:predicted nucleotidyltransferase